MNSPAQTLLLTGNHAVAWAARLARPKVVPLYPITPQTPVLEKLTEFQAAGEFDAEVLTPEQRQKVAENMAKRQEGRRGWFGRGEGRGEGRGPGRGPGGPAPDAPAPDAKPDTK